MPWIELRQMRLVPCKEQIGFFLKRELNPFVRLHSLVELQLSLCFYLAASILLLDAILKLLIE